MAHTPQLVQRQDGGLVVVQLDRELPALGLEHDAEHLDAACLGGGDELGVVDEPVKAGAGLHRTERLLLQVGQGQGAPAQAAHTSRWHGSPPGRPPSAAGAAAGWGGSSAGGETTRRSRRHGVCAAPPSILHVAVAQALPCVARVVLAAGQPDLPTPVLLHLHHLHGGREIAHRVAGAAEVAVFGLAPCTIRPSCSENSPALELEVTAWSSSMPGISAWKVCTVMSVGT